MTDKKSARERYEDIVAQCREQAAALSAATDQVETEPVSDVVRPVFDADGYLIDLQIDSTALRTHTNVELEGVMTKALQDANKAHHDATLELLDRYWTLA